MDGFNNCERASLSFMNGVPLTSTSGEAMEFWVKFVLLLSQEKG